ncbi:MAG: glycosyltransferase [Oscillospiraceae bacterium]|nr:glycosyltransferase [Oscillospiraceae bacterium]
MTVVLLSNFLNHHQLPLCKAFLSTEGVDFTFIATENIPQERLDLGYDDMNHTYKFVLCTYDCDENERKALELCNNCDVLITGSAPDYYFRKRVRDKKLTFKYGERFFRTPFSYKNVLQRTGSMLKHLIPYQNENYYLLCASAFMPADCKKYNLFPDRIYKWAYFTEVIEYNDFQSLMGNKKTASILWAGRLIGLKHPDASILVAERLRENNIPFELNIIGSGELEDTLKEMIKDKGLQDCVHMLGSMSARDVRRYMEASQIFLFTSDMNEGWGAVLNESMNSGCAVVASDAIGSVPFLIRDKKNGLVYESGNVDELYEATHLLLTNSSYRTNLSYAAYNTMLDTWNADVAVDRFLNLVKAIKNNETCNIYDTGPCSKARVIEIKG